MPDKHKFPLAKYRLLREALSADRNFDLRPAQPAERNTLLRVHDESYVDGFLRGSLPPAAMRRIGFPWSPQLVMRTLASVGGTLSATRAALDEGIGGTLAGGTHHAYRGEGSGFCVFNDIATAIEMLRAERGMERFAVVDLDVHQGDGTAAIFSADDSVFTLSLHGASNFPFRKQQSRMDVALADRTKDDEYLHALESALPHVWRFEPEVIFFQAGVDALGSDTLGRLSLSEAGLHRRDIAVMEGARSRGLPVVITLGGGYSDPLELTVRAHAETFRAAAVCLPMGAADLEPAEVHERHES